MLLHEVCKAHLERPELLRLAAGTLGVKDQYLSSAQGARTITQWVLVHATRSPTRSSSSYGDGAHDACREPSQQSIAKKIIGGCDGAQNGQGSQREQARQSHGVKMAVVVCHHHRRACFGQMLSMPYLQTQQSKDKRAKDEKVPQISKHFDHDDFPSGLKLIDEVKEQGRREDQTIDAIEHSAVARDEFSCILDAQVAF